MTQQSRTKGACDPTYHRDHTVTIWDVYRQQWVRTSRPTDQQYAAMSEPERSRIERWVAQRAER